MDVQTYFFPAGPNECAGKPRSWTDHALCIMPAHGDLFQYQSGQLVSESFALQGPLSRRSALAMDMSIGLKVPGGAHAPVAVLQQRWAAGTFFRYICDNGPYICRYDDLFDGKNNQIDVSKATYR